MATATVEKKTTKNGQHGGGASPPEPEHLPCPRCASTNTKFCYYNNYNYSQPRHFCKACRRYWTHGGTLRDIPVGGGSRKNTKRSRTTTSTGAADFSPAHHDFRHLSSTPVLVPMSAGDRVCSTTFLGDGKVSGSFTSLLSNTHGPGLLALGGFGLDDVGFGLGRAVWPFYGMVEGGQAGGDGGGTAASGHGWQLDNGESGFVGDGDGGRDCFAWPDLAISTPGTLLK